jgi:hypothetical protein
MNRIHQLCGGLKIHHDLIQQNRCVSVHFYRHIPRPLWLVGRGAIVDVTVQVEVSLPFTKLRVVVQIDRHSIVGDDSVIINLIHADAAHVGVVFVVITPDEDDPTIEHFADDRPIFLRPERKIANVDYGVFRGDDSVPVGDKNPVHFRDIRKGPIAIADDVGVVKMGV